MSSFFSISLLHNVYVAGTHLNQIILTLPVITHKKLLAVNCSLVIVSACKFQAFRYQGFSYLSEVRARGLLTLGEKAIGSSKLGKLDAV